MSDQEPGRPRRAATAPGFKKALEHMANNKIEAALWITRMITVVYCILFLLPIFGGDPVSHYQKALFGCAVTSALRLHQRIPAFHLNREFLAALFLEDSFHYLFYSVVFALSYPISVSLVPVFLFALLHSGNYTKQLLDQFGPNRGLVLRKLIGKLDQNQVQVLRFIACSEIFMMPSIIFMILYGRVYFLMPVVYYRFLSLRYTSRRNPYCRHLFYELRVATYQLTNHPSCPVMIRNAADRVVEFINRLAPTEAPQQQQQQQNQQDS